MYGLGSLSVLRLFIIWGFASVISSQESTQDNKVLDDKLAVKRSQLLAHMAERMNLDGEGLRHIRKHLIDVVGRHHLDDIFDFERKDNMKGIFYFFKLHDNDNNQKLDGLEWLKALTDFHEGHKVVDEKEDGVNFMESEAITIIDELLEKHDKDNDGMIDFVELMNTKVDSIVAELVREDGEKQHEQQQADHQQQADQQHHEQQPDQQKHEQQPDQQQQEHQPDQQHQEQQPDQQQPDQQHHEQQPDQLQHEQQPDQQQHEQQPDQQQHEQQPDQQQHEQQPDQQQHEQQPDQQQHEQQPDQQQHEQQPDQQQPDQQQPDQQQHEQQPDQQQHKQQPDKQQHEQQPDQQQEQQPNQQQQDRQQQ